VPICLELTDGSAEVLGMEKEEVSKTGTSVRAKVSSTRAVERWR
jgi:hypothetical protein